VYILNVHIFQSYFVIFYLSVVKVDLNVRLFSEKERAIVRGIMAASAVS
jgi:hypothetical protein